jgi:stalled ribosome alternative rescue factor ArfA
MIAIVMMIQASLVAIIWRLTMRIKPINPIARLMAHNRRRAQVVPAKKGKGSYNRNKAKEQTNAEQNNDK